MNTKVKLPNADKARIDRRKLSEYLLSETHPIGKFKGKSSQVWASIKPIQSNLKSNYL